MDALLQIIVPKIREIEGLKITQPIYEWDGVEYPQGPKIVSWQNISFSFDEKADYFNKFLPPNYLGEDWIWLKVSDETLDKYEISVNNKTESSDEKMLETFLLAFLTDYDKWVIAFLPQYDQIDNVYKLKLKDSIAKLRSNSNRNIKKEGFIAYAES